MSTSTPVTTLVATPSGTVTAAPADTQPSTLAAFKERVVEWTGWGAEKGKQAVSNTASLARKELHDVLEKKAATNDTYTTPVYEELGADYDATFQQDVTPNNRVIVATPNLLGVFPRGGLPVGQYLQFHAVSSGNQADQQLITQYGMSWDHRPQVSLQPVWYKRPMHFTLNSWTSTPLKQALTTVGHVSAEVFDDRSGVGVTGSFSANHQMEVQSVALSSKYCSLTGAVNANRSTGLRTISAGLSQTLHRNALLDRSVVLGVKATSAAFQSFDDLPKKVDAVAGKLQWLSPKVGFDAAGTLAVDSGKLSDVRVRALGCFNQGTFPRGCYGVSVALTPSGGAPSSTTPPLFSPYLSPTLKRSLVNLFETPQQVQPCVTASLNYVLNASERIKLRVDSNSLVSGTYECRLAPQVRVGTTVTSKLPPMGSSLAGQALQTHHTSMGITLKLGE